MSFMVKVNILQLLTAYVLQFIINDTTLHLLSSSFHWECRSLSGHRYEISSGGDGNCQLRHYKKRKKGQKAEFVLNSKITSFYSMNSRHLFLFILM